MTQHRPQEDRRSDILTAARAVFVERGFLSARVEDVARRARLSKGAVYFHFKSKREILDALVAEEHAETQRIISTAAADPRPAAVKIVAIGKKYLDYIAGLKSPPRFFLLMNEMATRDERLREEVTRIHERFVAQTAALIAEAIAEGSFRDVDPVAAALLLKAIVDGLAGQAAIGLRPDAQRLAGEAVGVLLHGLARAPAGEGGPGSSADGGA